MRDKIYAYLKSQKAGAASKEIVEQVLKIRGASPHISEKLIQTAISGDRRFTVDEHHLWKIIEKEGTPLSEAVVVLLSLLTIDTPQKSGIIVEISAQKFWGGNTADRFHTLINPGASIIQTMHLPADFAQEVKGGIPLEKAARLFSDFAGDGILIGYDIHSSINRLNAVLIRSNEMIENSPLCLKFLAKKLIPDLQQKSINDIAAFFKLSTIDTRRTETEVCTIAEIFSLCRELLKEQGFSTVEEVLEFQYPDIDTVDL
jgi:DNA polymerase III alpha subunit (gram-positive type)